MSSRAPRLDPAIDTEGFVAFVDSRRWTERWEFVDGHLVPMVGVTWAQDPPAGNVFSALRSIREDCVRKFERDTGTIGPRMESLEG